MSETVTAVCAADVVVGHRWHPIRGQYLHFAGYRLPPPDAPDPEWTYWCCSRGGEVLTHEPPSDAPEKETPE